MQIQRGHHLITGHWMVDGGAKVQTQHINNDLGAIVKYTGTMPVYQAPTAINPAVYKHLWDLYEKAFELRPEDYQAPLLMAQILADLERPDRATAARRAGLARHRWRRRVAAVLHTSSPSK